MHQTHGWHHNAMPIGVRIVREGDAILILESYQPGHGIRAGGVHADLAIMIDRHERERGVDDRIHDDNVQVIDRVDRLPIRPGGTTERVYPQLEAGGADEVHIDDVPQILNVRHHEVLLVCRVCLDGGRKGQTFDAGVALAQQSVGPVLDPRGDVEVSGTTVGWIVLETAVLRRVVRGRDDNAVGEVPCTIPVVNEDVPRDDRCRRDAVALLDDGLHCIGRQHLQCGALGRRGQGVCVLPHVEWAVDALTVPIVTNGLRNGENVRFGE